MLATRAAELMEADRSTLRFTLTRHCDQDQHQIYISCRLCQLLLMAAPMIRAASGKRSGLAPE